ncbi:hypothetical protein FOMPIDRAFT_113800 [Fomitopsis schrenkii]|uniref:Uncharacterized protein n=1 Tax=Fomitopsis schrenkii TaxID=2126942 RepID=S8FYT7_FOMSC|nr:hypothetical protein FOMPIDRAFT_113800 [Fomitopsis schrenkii]
MRCMSASCVSATHQCGRKVDSGDEEDSQAETEANLDLASRWPIEPALSARHAPPRPAAAPTWPQLGSSCNITTTIDYRAHSNWTCRHIQLRVPPFSDADEFVRVDAGMYEDLSELGMWLLHAGAGGDFRDVTREVAPDRFQLTHFLLPPNDVVGNFFLPHQVPPFVFFHDIAEMNTPRNNGFCLSEELMAYVQLWKTCTRSYADNINMPKLMADAWANFNTRSIGHISLGVYCLGIPEDKIEWGMPYNRPKADPLYPRLSHTPSWRIIATAYSLQANVYRERAFAEKDSLQIDDVLRAARAANASTALGFITSAVLVLAKFIAGPFGPRGDATLRELPQFADLQDMWAAWAHREGARNARGGTGDVTSHSAGLGSRMRMRIDPSIQARMRKLQVQWLGMGL